MRRFIALLCVILSLFAAAFSEEKLRKIEEEYPVPEYVQRLLAVAKEELGYTERKDGYTKYGQWVNNPYAQWCAEFLCWAVNEVDTKYDDKLLKNIYPLYGGQNVGMRWFIKEGRFIARTGFLNGFGSQWRKKDNKLIEKNGYIPQPGDWAFFSYTPSGDTTHVAMVEFASRDKENKVFVHVIEGNNPDKVQRNVYKIDDWRIIGYGTVHDIADFALRLGSESKKVTILQEKLAELGLLDPSMLTGKFGAATENAVKAFQTKYGMEVNGVANYKMQMRLNEEIKNYLQNNPDGWIVDSE